MIAISYDPADKLAAYAKSANIQFSLLSDPKSETIRNYGVLHKGAPTNVSHEPFGFAHPGTFLIDKRGIVRETIFLDLYQHRHSNADLIRAATRIK